MPMQAPQIIEGYVPFHVAAAGKACRTWYKIIGDLECGVTPLVVIHGGPGLSHDYMLPLAGLNKVFGIPVVFYDQIGNGRSTHLPEKAGDETFWTESLFHAELSNLVSKLSLHSYDILGHSWGGMMSSTFAGRLRPRGLRKLVLSNAPATNNGWDNAYAEYKASLPVDVLDEMKRCEDSGTTGSAEYEKLMKMFNKKHFCIIDPFPKEWQVSLDWRASDPTVKMATHGPNKWVVTGSLKEWTSVPWLSNITVPTLMINGIDEGASDTAVAPFLDFIPNVKWIKLRNSTHMPHFEEKDNYLRVVGEWLGESTQRRASKL